ncbi:MAG: hypothetical protein KAU21_18490, partial [Gammaproteobacteria bacterium]|nr:hypothetical protein [Gammaproteobacteria bacterium]
MQVKAESSEAAVVEKVAAKIDKISSIKVQSLVPYAKGSMVAANIKNECKINKQLSDYIFSYSAEKGIAVSLQGQVTENSAGQALVVEITQAVSSGNAFIGHRKFTSIKGSLFNNGTKQASFTAARTSGGGFFGGFKGSCSVLGR